MKTWAQIDTNNLVIDVIVVGDEKTNVKKWLEDRLGGTWIQTFSPRHVEDGTDQSRFVNPARPGGSWDGANKVFLDPKPFPSWVLDDNFKWQAPLPLPADSATPENPEGVGYEWDEEAGDWVVEQND